MFKSISQSPGTPELKTFGDFLHYAYANMQMLIMAISTGREKFDRTCFMVRSKAFKSYRTKQWHIQDLHINNVWKMMNGEYCWYCLSKFQKQELTIEHIFPRSKGGSNDIDNIVLVCKSCNSSKQALDVLEWFIDTKKEWPKPYVFAYYLKLVYLYAVRNNLLDLTSEEIDQLALPFKYQYLPLRYSEQYLEDSSNACIDKRHPDNADAYIVT